MTVQKQVADAFERGVKLFWVIHTDHRFIDVHPSADRKQYRMLREHDTVDAGDIQPGYSIKVADLFEEVVVA
jgi:hypothetical protein